MNSLPVRLPDGSFPPFFFLRRQRVLDRPCAADLFIGLDQSPAQVLILPETGDLALGFPLGRSAGKTLRNGFAIDFVGKPRVGSMAGIIRLMTMATWGAATTGSC
jgi:hypothetical protein